MSKEFLHHHQELNSDKFSPKYPSLRAAESGFRSLEDEVMHQRIGDGNSRGSSSKHSDSMSDDVAMTNGNSNVPYEVLLQDLTQAKRQLIELHNLVSFFLL